MLIKKQPHIILVAILLYVNVALSFTQNQFTPEERAWLYRIVKKSPVLDKNWGSFFQFDNSSFCKNTNGSVLIDYDSILKHQKLIPQSLVIKIDSISKSSSGVVSEAAIKMAFLELNEGLKSCLSHSSACNDSLYKSFIIPLISVIPQNVSDKNTRLILDVLMNPSIPIFLKLEQLLKFNMLDGKEQLALFEAWNGLIANYISVRSLYFGSTISSNSTFDDLIYLAAGEGSGSAGLLNENDVNPLKPSENFYGKAVGLFNYGFTVSNNVLQPQGLSKESILIPPRKSIAIHSVLWGLNGSLKPLIVFTLSNKSYQLYTNNITQELSPDPNSGKGISHLDRINQFKQIKVNKPIADLQKEGGLENILQKELVIKEKIEFDINRLGIEIDSLRKLLPASQVAIDARKVLVNSSLTNLTDKTTRIVDLQRKLSLEYKVIDNAQKKLSEMTALLGVNPQKWILKDGDFEFEDGVIFNVQNQDLIFPAREKSSELEVVLVSAGYTLEGDKKDEVQVCLCVNYSKDLPNYLPQMQAEIQPISFNMFYFPDAIRSFTVLDSMVVNRMKKMIFTKPNEIKFVRINVAPSLDSLKSVDEVNAAHYFNIQREFDQPITPLGLQRRAHVSMQLINDTVVIFANGFADGVSTRLSQVSCDVRNQLKVNRFNVDNNLHLSVLRAVGAIDQVLEISGISEKNSFLMQIKNEYHLTDHEFRILLSVFLDEKSKK